MQVATVPPKTPLRPAPPLQPGRDFVVYTHNRQRARMGRFTLEHAATTKIDYTYRF